MSFTEIERLIDRYDAATATLDAAVTDRISNSMDASFRAMVKALEREYPVWQSQGSLYASQRRLLLLNELGPLLAIVRPEEAEQYQALMEQALQLSHATGATLADQLITIRDPGYPLQDFATIPIEAAVAQARDGVGRLYRYDEEFRTAASAIVEAGLIQGFGPKRVQQGLDRELGVAKGKAETLARTEVMSALNTASQERYERAGIGFVQVFNTPSERLCPFCLARHGNVYEVGQVSVPFHPRCRDILAPWSPKWQERGLTDDAAIEANKTALLAEMQALGTQPNSGPTYWEKKAGLTAAPTPVWKPGDAVAAAPAARAATPVAPAPAAPPALAQRSSRDLGNIALARFGVTSYVRTTAVWENRFADPSRPKPPPPPGVEEMAAITTYTGSDFKQINALLRGREDKLVGYTEEDREGIRAAIELANRGLGALTGDRYEGTVYRGTPYSKKRFDTYEPGATVTEGGFTSSSTDGLVAADAFGGSGGMFFRIQSRTGVNVVNYSDKPGEDEVLFRSGTRFRVISRELDEFGDVVIELEEDAD